jgi:glucose/arabinose dehydrogenase
MKRRLFADVASLVALAMMGCGTDPPATGGTAGNSSTSAGNGAGGQSTGGTPGAAGNTTGGVPTTAGTAGSSTAGTATTAGTGGQGMGGQGMGGMPPACAAVTPLNGAGVTLSATDISAFKFSNAAAGNVTKMAYDPVGKVLVILGQDGKMYKADPMVAIPATASTAALTTTAAYDAGGYAAEGDYKDHRGIAFGKDGTLYVLAVRGGADVGVVIKKGVPGAGGARTWTTLVSTNGGFPAGGTNFDHSFSNIELSPDGASLYFSSGSRTDHGEMEAGQGEVPLSSAVFKVPTATPTVLKNDQGMLAPVLFADGTRNAFDMAFNAAGDLISCENGPDMDLPDEINFLQQGKHYGFPFRFGAINNPVAEAGYTAAGDKRLHAGYQAVDTNKYVFDASLVAPGGTMLTDPIINMGPDANVSRADRNAEPAPVAAGLAGITGHRSPLGIVFDTEGKLCGPYYKQGLVLSYGSVKPDALGDQGRDLLLLTLTKSGEAYTMGAKKIAAGIESPMDAVLIGNKLFTIGFGNAPMYVFVLPTP